MVSFAGARAVGERVFADFSDKNVSFMAAGLAYNAFVSLAPLLIVLFLVLGVVGGGLEDRVLQAAQDWLPGPIAEVVSGLLTSEGGAGSVSVIGFVVLVWGSFKIFRGLDTAFSEVYETTADNSLTDKFRNATVVFGALIAAVVATVGTSAVFAVFADSIPFLGLLTPLVLVVGLVLAFYPIFYVFPDADVEVRDVLPGAAFAAVGWAVFQSLFQVYLRFSDPGSSSFFGGVIVVVTYLYFSALVLLLGAVINAVTGDHAAGRPGGVGAGAADREKRREERLDGEAVDAYLRALDERLTARYDVADPSEGTLPRPDGDVRLREYASDGEDGRRWTVELSWVADTDSSAANQPVAEPADD